MYWGIFVDVWVSRCCCTTCVLFVKSAKQIEIYRIHERTTTNYEISKYNERVWVKDLFQGLVRGDCVSCDQRWLEVKGTGISFDMISLNIHSQKIAGDGVHLCWFHYATNIILRECLMWKAFYIVYMYIGYNYSFRENKWWKYIRRVHWIQLFIQKTNDEYLHRVMYVWGNNTRCTLQ